MNQPKYKGNGRPTNPESLHRAQIRRQNALAERDELKNRVTMGELIRRDAAEREMFRKGRQLRDALQNIPARIAGLVAPEKNQHKCFDIIKRQLDQALESFIGGKGTA